MDIIDIATRAGKKVSPSGTNKYKIACPLPSHGSGDSHASAVIFTDKQNFFCSKCQVSLTKRQLAEALGERIDDDYEDSRFPDSHAIPSWRPKEPPITVSIPIEKLMAGGVALFNGPPKDRYTPMYGETWLYVGRRGLTQAVLGQEEAVLLPVVTGPIPAAQVGSWERQGRLLVTPLYSLDSGQVVSAQGRRTVEAPKDTRGPKVISASGLKTVGAAFLNRAARKMLEKEISPGLIVVVEGDVDFLTATGVCPEIPVVGAPGAGNAAKIVGGWVKGSVVLLAMDNDAAGKTGAAAASAKILELGGAPVAFPLASGADLNDALAEHGREALADQIRGYHPEEPTEEFGGLRKSVQIPGFQRSGKHLLRKVLRQMDAKILPDVRIVPLGGGALKGQSVPEEASWFPRDAWRRVIADLKRLRPDHPGAIGKHSPCGTTLCCKDGGDSPASFRTLYFYRAICGSWLCPSCWLKLRAKWLLSLNKQMLGDTSVHLWYVDRVRWFQHRDRFTAQLRKTKGAKYRAFMVTREGQREVAVFCTEKPPEYLTPLAAGATLIPSEDRHEALAKVLAIVETVKGGAYATTGRGWHKPAKPEATKELVATSGKSIRDIVAFVAGLGHRVVCKISDLVNLLHYESATVEVVADAQAVELELDLREWSG